MSREALPQISLAATVCLLTILFISACSGAAAGDPPQSGSDSPAFEDPSGYALAPDGDRWSGVSGRQHLRLVFSHEGVRVGPADLDPPVWKWQISLARYGGIGDSHLAGDPTLEAEANEARYRWGGLIEWIKNGPEGIELGLDIPQGLESEILQFDFRILGSLSFKLAKDGSRVTFFTGSAEPVLTGLELSAQDASGREVAVRWEKGEGDGTGRILRIAVHSQDHAFPLRVVARFTSIGKKTMFGESARVPEIDSLLSAPANDTCAGAEVIPSSGPFPYLSSITDLTDATTAGDPPAPSCQASVSRSLWYSFTPATTASYTLSVCGDATGTTVEDTVLAIYSAAGTCAGLAELAGACSDDACGPTGLQSTLSDVALVAGTTYSIVVWSYGSAVPSGGGNVQLRVMEQVPTGQPPPNDQCSGAETIPGAGPFPYLTSVTSDISGAGVVGDPPAPSCQAAVSRSIWYSFAPAASGRYAFSVCADGPTGTTVDDTVLAIYAASGSCLGLVQLAGGCDDDSCLSEAAQSSISGVDLAAGTRYYIVVWSYGTAPLSQGNSAVQLRVNHLTSPLNDRCEAAAELDLDAPVPGTTLSASDDTELPSGSGCFSGIGQIPSTATGSDVAYRFTAPESGLYSFRLSGFDPSKNAVLYVASDCPGGEPPQMVSSCLGAANRTSTGPEEVSCLPLGAGQTVFVYVDENTMTAGSPFVLEADRCLRESEPNDTSSSAQETACGLEGSIAPAGDVDFFLLGLADSGSRLFALVDGAAGNSTDFDLRVTTSMDTLEYDDLNNDVPFGSVAPNLSGTRLPGVMSYLRVSHYSVAGQAEPYRLYQAVQPPSSRATPEVEPNDTIANATGSSNEYYSGALSGTGDVDIFSFVGSAGESVQIGLDLDPSRDDTPFNGSLALLDATGATLLQVNDPSWTSSTASGAGSLSATTPYSPGEALVYRIRSNGAYFVKVAWSSGIPGDYLLSIAHDCRVGPATDLALTQVDSSDPVPSGGQVSYTLQVHNLGGNAASAVILTDDPPADGAFVSIASSQGSCEGSGPIHCYLGDLAGGAIATVILVINAPAGPGMVLNSARISSAVIDPNAANDSAQEATLISGTDSDGDGVQDAADCAPGDANVWAIPGEAMGLAFSTVNPALLQWSAPSALGGTSVLYDLLRSGTAGGFQGSACLAEDLTATSAMDPAVPLAVFYYLVRAGNACGGNLGTRSDGTPRSASSCP